MDKSIYIDEYTVARSAHYVVCFLINYLDVVRSDRKRGVLLVEKKSTKNRTVELN